MLLSFSDVYVIDSLMNNLWGLAVKVMILEIKDDIEEVIVALRQMVKPANENMLLLCDLNNTQLIISEVNLCINYSFICLM